MSPDISSIERFTGTYAIEGQTPDGRHYTGTMKLVRKGAFLHADADLDPLGQRFGIAMPFAGRLVMAFGAKDQVEIGAYQIEGPTVRGLWIPPGATDDDFAKCGIEEATLAEPGPAAWTITNAQAVDQSAYTGGVRLTPMDGSTFSQRPTPVTMTWTLHDGTYHSFGLAYADAVYSTFHLAKDQPRHGIAVYEMNGDSFSGVALSSGASRLTTESIRRA